MVDIFLEFAKELQKKLVKLLKFERVEINKIRKVACIDVAYKEHSYYAIGIISRFKTWEIIEKVEDFGECNFPYIPSFFFLKEGPIILKIVKKFKNDFDLLILDAHGYAHPRRMGLACVIGILVEKPTIGIAKSLLCGKEEKINEKIWKIVDNELIGFKIRGNREFYISPGNKIDFQSLLEFVEATNYEYPKILEIVDNLTKKKIREIEKL